MVYLARDTVGKVDVALKTLHPLLKQNPEEMEELASQFALVSRLAHPNIASPLVLHPCLRVEIWSDEARKELRLSPGDPVMVMRYAPGVTLSKWRRQFSGRVVPLPLALEIGRQIAAALDYAHSERIVHRDVKPGNIMVETLGEGALSERAAPATARSENAPSLRVRILDFGLAAEIRSSMSRVSTETGNTSGTRPYMAPEQWLGRKQDGRTDQYALACVLYELLSGAPPFAGVFETGDPVIMRTAVERDAPEEIESVPTPVNAALLRALAKAPKDRFPSCAAFVAALGGGAEPFTQSRGDSGGAEISSHAENAEDAEKDAHAESAEGFGRKRSLSAPQGGASRPGEPQSDSTLETDVLRRKIALVRALSSLSAEDRENDEFKPFVSEAEEACDVANEALSLSHFTTAAQCFDRAEAALGNLRRIKDERRKPILAVSATLPNGADAADATLSLGGKTYLLPVVLKLENGKVYGPGGITLKNGGKTYVGTLERIPANWPGEKKTVVRLKERKGPKPGKRGGDRYVATIAGVSIPLRWCPPGSFTMGSENGDSDERPTLLVTVPNGFWMGETEVTQELWRNVMGDGIKPYNDKGGSYPMENISWNNCLDFVNRLNERADVKSRGLRFALPTEAQWEYACRAGGTGDYGRTKDRAEGRLDDMGWYLSNIGYATHPATELRTPNAWGILNMHGNVWEWCANVYRDHPDGSLDNDSAVATSGDNRVLRGGSFWGDARICRSAYRYKNPPGNRLRIHGLRLLAFQDGK